MSEPTLMERMRTLAETHPRGEELRAHADALDAATADSANIPKLVGTWAKARRLWQEITGEPLP